MATKFLLLSLAASIAATAIPSVALADGRGYDDGYYQDHPDNDRRGNYRRYDDRRGEYRNQNYGGYYRQNNRGQYYAQDRRGYYADTRYNGGRGQYRCRDQGNGGTIIGAIAGGLLGNTVAGRGDRLLGTVIGGGVGALAGNAIDKSDGRPC